MDCVGSKLMFGRKVGLASTSGKASYRCKQFNCNLAASNHHAISIYDLEMSRSHEIKFQFRIVWLLEKSSVASAAPKLKEWLPLTTMWTTTLLTTLDQMNTIFIFQTQTQNKPELVPTEPRKRPLFNLFYWFFLLYFCKLFSYNCYLHSTQHNHRSVFLLNDTFIWDTHGTIYILVKLLQISHTIAIWNKIPLCLHM